MKAMTVFWDDELDDTKIQFSEQFMDAGWTAQMDIMKDIIGILEKHYNNMLSQENGTFIYEVKQ